MGDAAPERSQRFAEQDQEHRPDEGRQEMGFLEPPRPQLQPAQATSQGGRRIESAWPAQRQRQQPHHDPPGRNGKPGQAVGILTQRPETGHEHVDTARKDARPRGAPPREVKKIRAIPAEEGRSLRPAGERKDDAASSARVEQSVEEVARSGEAKSGERELGGAQVAHQRREGGLQVLLAQERHAHLATVGDSWEQVQRACPPLLPVGDRVARVGVRHERGRGRGGEAEAVDGEHSRPVPECRRRPRRHPPRQDRRSSSADVPSRNRRAGEEDALRGRSA